MKGKNSITINGRLYDAVTGMPIQNESTVSVQKTVESSNLKKSKRHPVPRPTGNMHRAFTDIAVPRKTQPTPFKKVVAAIPRAQTEAPAQAVHQRPQKSQTLHRAALKRPEAEQSAVKQERSPAISKFAQQTVSQPAQQPPVVVPSQPTDEQAKVHPAVAKALATIQSNQVPARPEQPRSSKELKELLIKERLAEVEAVDNQTQQKKEKKGFFRSKPRLTTILTSTLAILLLGGYLTYINLPNISMRVAATRAGIAANFPNYKPDGYGFQGPITYAPGEVSISYKSNTNNSNFTLKQKGSNWDSQAVLDNYVSKQAENYLTYQEQGLTIYSFDNKAAWVNGGLLYTIEGNTQLSSEQLLKLATSM